MPTEEQIDAWRAYYTFRLAPQTTDRCRDCKHARLEKDQRASCVLLYISIYNAQKSRCDGHEPRNEKEGRR